MRLTPDHPAGVEVPGTRSARVLADLGAFKRRYDLARGQEDGQPCRPCSAPAPVIAMRRAAIGAAIRAMGLTQETTNRLVAAAQAEFDAGASAASAIDNARKAAKDAQP